MMNWELELPPGNCYFGSLRIDYNCEKRLFTCVREFYVVAISKMLEKFPFIENVIKELTIFGSSQSL